MIALAHGLDVSTNLRLHLDLHLYNHTNIHIHAQSVLSNHGVL